MKSLDFTQAMASEGFDYHGAPISGTFLKGVDVAQAVFDGLGELKDKVDACQAQCQGPKFNMEISEDYTSDNIPILRVWIHNEQPKKNLLQHVFRTHPDSNKSEGLELRFDAEQLQIFKIKKDKYGPELDNSYVIDSPVKGIFFNVYNYKTNQIHLMSGHVGDKLNSFFPPPFALAFRQFLDTQKHGVHVIPGPGL